MWGINAYPSAPLSGCINDVVDYAATLTAKGFSYQALTDSMATKARILTELNSLVINSKTGDSLVVAGSSHGSYIPDQNGDESDGLDELVVPYDWPYQYIRDDELKAIFDKLPAGVTCDVFLDCCYSGTGTRLVAPVTHKIPVIGSRYVAFTGKVPKKVAAKAVIVPTMKENFWAASRDNQTSAEILVNGIPRGAFSYYICKAIRTYPNFTRDQLVAYAVTKIKALGINQTPQLECPASEAGQLPFV